MIRRALLPLLLVAALVGSTTAGAVPAKKKRAPFDKSLTYDDVKAALFTGGIATCTRPELGEPPTISAGAAFESQAWFVSVGPCPVPDQYGYVDLNAYDGDLAALAYSSKKLRDQDAKGLGQLFLVGYKYGRFVVVLTTDASPELIEAFVATWKETPKAALAFDER